MRIHGGAVHADEITHDPLLVSMEAVLPTRKK
jgi:hypothetical protein